MSKVVLHIGTHKTATTTIQDMFYENADLLAQHDVVYPKLYRHTGHHGLVLNWDNMPPAYHLDAGPIGTLTKLVEDYADTDKTLFLSSEEFSRDRCLTELGRIREMLEPFDEIEVICVLRQQWQFLQSVYLEVSKTRVPPRPPMLVDPVIESGMFEGLWVDYNGILDRLEAAFAPEEITLLDFDSCRKADHGIIGYMFDHLGIDLDPARMQPVNNGASNVSPMSLASWAANILAEPKVAPEWLVAKTTETLKLEFGADVKPCLFTRPEFHTLKDHFNQCNQELRDRREEVQPDFAMPKPSPESLSLFRNEIPGPFWARIARRLVMDLMD